MINDHPRCPICQAILPHDAPAGVCPACLLKMAMSPASTSEGERTSSFVSSGGRGWEPPPVAELAGRFPQLEILQLIGRGGMGAVYLGRQRALDRFVAVKILPPDSNDPAFADRFEREARALARLNHPHIVSVYDSGQVDGLFYFVMEFVDGVNLREAMRSGTLPPREALAIVAQVCEALQYAHDEGIVHRDIKPENILLDKRGRVKIADFGLAKLLGSDTAEHSLTGTYQVMGTPRYMAPEQLEGTKGVDHRADIYSLGVVFYELLTGELPLGRFAAPSKKTQCDVRLDDVVFRTLEKEPAERFQNARDVKTEVDFISSSNLPAAPTPAPSVTIPHQLMPRALADLGLGSVLGVCIVTLYWVLPAILLAVVITNTTTINDNSTVGRLALFGGFACFAILGSILALGAPSKATIDAAGITIHRMLLPPLHFAWSEIAQLSPMTRLEVFARVWLWPGFPPRGSIVGMSAWPFVRIETSNGPWHFCPSDPTRFLQALARFAPANIAVPETGEDGIDTEVAEARRQALSRAGRSASVVDRRAATPARKPWLVPIFAVCNLLVAVVFMLSAFVPDELGKFVAEKELYQAYSYLIAAATYLSSAMLFAGSIGMLLWKPWGRWLTVAVCAYTLVMVVVEMPIVVLYMIPAMRADFQAEFAGGDASVGVPMFFVMPLVIMVLIGLAWTVGQLVYLTRPRVAAAFDPPSPAWSAVRVPVATWTVLFLLACGGIGALYLSPLGPRVEETRAVSAVPKSGSYERLDFIITFVDTPAWGAPEAPSDWRLDVCFYPRRKDGPPVPYHLLVDLPKRSAVWQEQGASNVLVLDTLDANDLNLVLGRDLGEQPVDAEVQGEHAALLRVVSVLAEKRPATTAALKTLMNSQMERHFTVGSESLKSRTVTGFALDKLLFSLVGVGAVFVLGVLAWGAAGRRIVAAGEKPQLRAQAEIQTLGSAIMLTGLLTLLGMLVAVPLLIWLNDQTRADAFEALIPIVGVWSFLGGLTMIVLGRRTRSLQGPLAPWIGSVLSIVPLSPLALVGIPVGVWGLWLLSHTNVEDIVTRAQEERAAGERSRAKKYSRDESLPYQLGSLIGILVSHSAAPSWCATFCGVVGALSVVLNWVRIHFHPSRDRRDVDVAVFQGYDDAFGIASACVFLLTALVLFAIGSLRRREMLRAAVIGVGGLLGAVLVGIYPASLHEGRFYYTLVKTEPLAGIYWAIACVVGLLLCAAWQLRRALAEKEKR